MSEPGYPAAASAASAAVPPPPRPAAELPDGAALRAQLDRLDAPLARQVCRLLPSIPPDARFTCWKALLGVKSSDETLALLTSEIDNCDVMLRNHRVIVGDAERTRSNIALFKTDEVQFSIVQVLRYYCASRGVKYKQGLNEVLAPFILVSGSLPTSAELYMCLCATVDRFLPRMFSDDDEFVSLQASLRLFRMLMLYHDPELCTFLDQYDIDPVLYATPWFLTLFARGHEAPVLFPLWDFLLTRDDPVMLHFMALGLLLSRRTLILACAAEEIPGALCRLLFESPEHVTAVATHALQLVASTPKAFRSDLNRVCYHLDPPAELVGRLESSICMTVHVEELVTAETSTSSGLTMHTGDSTPTAADSKAPEAIRYLVIDCRSTQEFDAGHLPLAYHVDPALLQDPEQLLAKVTALKSMQGCHFAIMGSGDVSVVGGESRAPLQLKGARSLDEDFASESTASPVESGADSDLATPKRRGRKDRERAPTAPGGLVRTVGSWVTWLAAADLQSDTVPGHRLIALFLLQHGFPHLSEVLGGFAAFHQVHAAHLGTSLVAHDAAVCAACVYEASSWSVMHAASRIGATLGLSTISRHVGKRRDSATAGDGSEMNSPAISQSGSSSSDSSSKPVIIVLNSPAGVTTPATTEVTSTTSPTPAVGEPITGPSPTPAGRGAHTPHHGTHTSWRAYLSAKLIGVQSDDDDDPHSEDAFLERQLDDIVQSHTPVPVLPPLDTPVAVEAGRILPVPPPRVQGLLSKIKLPSLPSRSQDAANFKLVTVIPLATLGATFNTLEARFHVRSHRPQPNLWVFPITRVFPTGKLGPRLFLVTRALLLVFRPARRSETDCVLEAKFKLSTLLRFQVKPQPKGLTICHFTQGTLPNGKPDIKALVLLAADVNEIVQVVRARYSDLGGRPSASFVV